MAELTYLDFDLTVRKNAAGGYKLEVTSPGGQPTIDFTNPFQPQEIEDLRGVVEGPAREVGVPPGDRTPDLGARLQIFGLRLYEAVFVNDVRAALSSTLLLAQQSNAGVRIRLHLDEAPDLAALPWEYLYDQGEQAYLSLSELTPIVRHMRLPGPASAVQITPPIRILVMISSPSDILPKLDAKQELARIEEGLRELKNVVEVTLVPRASFQALQTSLQQGTFHIFHFIGHGGFDPTTKVPCLMFEDAGGASVTATRDQLRVALAGHPSLRLVVLNSCDGARTDGADPFGGMAQGLVQVKIPAVIAMQFRITDTAAIGFAGALYTAIANNLPVDYALAEARKSVYLAENPTEWGTPVLFMRGADGRLFLVNRPTAEQQRQLQINTLSEDALGAIKAKRFAEAIQKLNEILKLQQAAKNG